MGWNFRNLLYASPFAPMHGIAELIRNSRASSTPLGDADLTDFQNNPDLLARAQAINNQYSGLTFSPNLLQALSEVFGDTSSRDYYYQNAQQQRDQALNDLRQANHAENYDSPEQAAARMRTAGQNPDLLGTQNGGAAAIPGPDETPLNLEALQSQAQQATEQLIQLPMNLLTTGMSFASGLAQLQGLDISNGVSELQGILGNNQAFVEFMAGQSSVPDKDTLLGSGIKLKPYAKDANGKITNKDEIDEYNNNLIADYMMESLQASVKHGNFKFPFKSKYAKNAASAFMHSIAGPDGKETLAYKTMRQSLINKLLSENKKTAEETSNPFFNLDISDYREALAPITKLAFDTEIFHNRALKKQYENDLDYQSVTTADGRSLGTAQGEADIQAADTASLRAEWDRKVDESMKQADDALARLEKSGKKWAGIMRLMLPYARVYLNSLGDAKVQMHWQRKTDSKGRTSSETSGSLGL